MTDKETDKAKLHHPMSKSAALTIADRLQKLDDPTLRSPDEIRLVIAALRYYGK
jgi:hypothetical protein